MIRHFLALEWKQYFRSSYWQKSIGLNLLLVFFALYFIVVFLMGGLALYPILKELYPDNDPFLLVNDFFFYWIIIDLLVRFFFQKLPVMSIKPLLTLPIKRSSILHFVLAKSAVSFLNLLPLFAAVPFAAVLVFEGYETVGVVAWVFLVLLVTLCINFLNFIIESLTAESELSFLPLILLTSALFALEYFGIVNFSQMVSAGFMSVVANPINVLVIVGLLIGLYSINYKILRGKLFLDSSLKSKVEEVKVADMAWTRRFGKMAPFMQLDLKLIWRNKRPRSSVFILVIGLLYGLFFYPQPMYSELPWIFPFIGIFVTGIFLINFGQFIPAWDSGYYKLLMSQNITYEDYLKSKFVLMALSVVALFVLSIPYVYFGWKILLAHFGAAVYNIGVNTHIMLFGGSFNRKKIDLNQRAAFNYQGTGAVQWIIGFPLMFLPMVIFAIAYYTINFEAGIAILVILGLLGMVFHQKLMKFITSKYQDSKYKMISAFSEDN
ncbi:MAG TPA: DUF5687 family protein [Aquaticitalea sp.]|nr:DUF5687 family protein [Aquaticitalea sp.]